MRLSSPQRIGCAAVVTGVLAGMLAAQPASTDWRDYIAGPTVRLNPPVEIAFAENNDGAVLDASAALTEDGVCTTLTRTGATSPKLAIDFGRPLSGKIEIVFGPTVTSAIGAAFSQRLEFLDIGSDTSEFYLGDLTVSGRPGVTWRTDNRRGFRYLLLYLPNNGTVTVDAVRVYHTPFLGTADTYDGHFLCNDDLLNRIWYGCVYTQEICTTNGAADIDGPWEIEDGSLSVSYKGGSEFGFTHAGAGWQDYALDFDVRIMPLGKACGWAFRATGDGDTYMWQIVSAQGGADANTLRKHVRQNGTWTSITPVSLPAPVAEGELHHVRCELAGSAIRTYLDGQLIDTTTDSTFGQGRIGFRSADGEHFHVDNVLVSDGGGTLFSDTFDGEFLVPDWLVWERAELLTINDGAKRDRVWVWGDLYPVQRTMYAAHWQPQIIAQTLRDGAEHQYDQAIENMWGGVLRGKIPAANGYASTYMAGDGFSAHWLDDYTFWWVLVLHHHWLHTGDLAFAAEMYPALLGVLDDWCPRKMNASGLINLAQGDWYWSFLRTGGVTAFNALYVRSLRCAAEIAQSLGHPADAAGWTARADAVQAAINTHLYNPAQKLYYDGQNDHEHYPLDANTLTILFGVADAPKITPILEQIATRMWSSIGTRASWPPYNTWGHNQHVWAWYVQYEVEARFQSQDDLRAFEAMRRPWGWMVDHDPGRTMWEFMMGDGTVENGLRNTDHGFSSGAAWLMSEYVGGIRPTSPGFTTFDILPHPGELTWVQCVFPTPLGGISIEYTISRTAKTFDATIGVPAGAVGRIAVPRLGTIANVTLDGQTVWSGHEPVGGATSDDHYLYFPDIGAGSHTLSAVFDPGIVAPDFDFDGDVDLEDFGHLQACMSGVGITQTDPACENARLDNDDDVDQGDFGIFKACLSGAGVAPNLTCATP